MSVYPEGVSGSEPAITGADMVGRTVTCQGGTVRVVPLVVVEQAARGLAGMDTSEPDFARAFAAGTVVGELMKVAEYSDVECGYESVQDVSLSGTTMSWECPRCGAHQEQEIPTTAEEQDQ